CIWGAGRVHLYHGRWAHFDIQASELPFGIAADHFTVIPLLKLNGDGLLDVIRGYTAVCGDVENAVLLRSLRAGDDLVDTRAVIGVELIPQGVLDRSSVGYQPYGCVTSAVRERSAAAVADLCMFLLLSACRASSCQTCKALQKWCLVIQWND
ncbi:MAG: hypothetical protein ACI4ME_11775, partial [Aristaeellaceae bacterium]